MQFSETPAVNKSLAFDSADLEIKARLVENELTIDVLKSGVCVHRLTIADVVGRMENSWIADMFAREDRVDLSGMSGEVDDYVRSLNIAQG
ncbi:MAG: hypothetical protein JXQ99_26675 [Hyphomicrobiaceae bacterium]